ncbi:hypothetical protein FH972_010595 [Carpinus fangiana]|uniref:Uncharacterized protein n=1 Tax=Carpinus fangiana TaxID=176857 RepID=A0A660KUT7_9ROSI|nr:hypothetical protein FH972_010595 [Carpinus fangiana]
MRLPQSCDANSYSGSHDKLVDDDPFSESRRNVGAYPDSGSYARALLRIKRRHQYRPRLELLCPSPPRNREETSAQTQTRAPVHELSLKPLASTLSWAPMTSSWVTTPPRNREEKCQGQPRLELLCPSPP